MSHEVTLNLILAGTVTTVTSVLDALERRRLVRRYPHPANRRSVLVEVTATGREVCADILARRHTLEKQWLAGMAESDRQELLRLLGEAKGLFSRAHVPPRPTTRPPDEGS